MAILKKNIWLLYYVFVALASTILVYNIYINYSHTLDNYKTEQENITKITANSLKSVFSQYEMILNILEAEITKDNELTKHEEIVEVFDRVVNLNSTILAIGVSNIQGDIYIRNSKYKRFKLQNLLEKEKSKNTFLKTVKSNQMIVGRTYYSKHLNKYLIPLKKTIRNTKGDVIGVIILGVDLNKGFDFFLKNQETSSLYESFLFRDFDYYFQISPNKNAMNPKVYDYQIDKKEVEKSINFTEKVYNLSIEEIKKRELIVTVKSEDGRETLSSSKFIHKFDLWLTTQIPMSLIYSSIIKSSITYISIFFIIILMLYLLFKYIYEAERKKHLALYKQANHDYLTRLYNRQYLSNVFEKDSSIDKYSLFFIDIDNFKDVNDNYGHIFGDELLRHVSLRLKKIASSDDIIVRYSGDEFLFISKETNFEKLQPLISKILKSLSSPYFIRQYKINTTASLGVASYPYHGKNFDEIKRAADIAMYVAKKKKNSFYFYEDSLKQKYHKKLLLEDRLKTSLENNEIYLVYQPQVNTKGELYGVEALVRWENEELGFVPPDKFIKIAETIGFINKLGKFIIQSALNDIKLIQKATNKSFQLSINISIEQFMHEDFYDEFTSYIEKENFNPKLVTLELTENIFIKDIDYIVTLLEKLKDTGIKISLDDFGTGYSSLSLLKKLPIDELKIDKTFVDDILTSKSSRNVARSIISIGKEFDMNILCEGVEYEEQAKELSKLECDLFQGYYFAKPLKKEALVEYIKKD